MAGRSGAAWTLTLAAFIGPVLVAGCLWLLSLAGAAWTRPAVLAVLGALGAASWALARSAPAPQPSVSQNGRWAWPHAAAATAAFAAAALLRWNVHADYVYHWGQKAARNALLGGIDFAFLTRPWNAHLHPDYPNLMPTLGAAGFVVAGEIRWLASAALAILWFAALAGALVTLASRLAATRLGCSAAAGVALWVAAAFAIGFRQAGGADLPMCAAVAAGAVLLTARPGRELDAQVAWVAAFAAGTKLEGMPLAALLLTAHFARTRGFLEPPKALLRRAAILTLPAALVFSFWLAGVARYGLFSEANTAGLEAERLGIALRGLADVATRGSIWRGSTAIFLALPALVLARRERWAALWIGAQLVFYIYAYAAGPKDTEHWIETSAARLLFHLLPSLWVLGIAWLDRRSAGPGSWESE
ncbi:MAG: hypothetical protein AAF725_11730 [Acidobacteriota bacterium]